MLPPPPEVVIERPPPPPDTKAPDVAFFPGDAAGTRPFAVGVRLPAIHVDIWDDGGFPSAGAVLRIAWGDGRSGVMTVPASATDLRSRLIALPRHAYARAGTYVVTVGVTDAAGNTGTQRSAPIAVMHRPRNTVRPRVRGKARPGHTVTCVPGRWAAASRHRVIRWHVAGHVVRRIRGTRLTIRGRRAAGWISCRVTATNAVGMTSATSRAVHVHGARRHGARRKGR